ncbi:hypothetical protein HanRHA438_Chr02g0056551 [Helianthus annuus]|nr:hypothetical protein HanRHA438_Chr02g0056551 [Helianthus annuus]
MGDREELVYVCAISTACNRGIIDCGIMIGEGMGVERDMSLGSGLWKMDPSGSRASYCGVPVLTT